jgi:diguanylate cyclase (GGDEF)-like protein
MGLVRETGFSHRQGAYAGFRQLRRMEVHMKISMRDEKSVIKVIDLCAALEEKALGIYDTLLDSAEDERMRNLWSTMVADEKEHRNYWLRLNQLCADGGVPEVFDEPRRYVDELQALMLRFDHIADHVKTEFRAPAVFVHVLRLEFLLLHPSFVILFNYLPREEDRISPSRSYEQHLGKLLNAMMDYEALSPEMELLGEAIGQVWKKSEEGAIRAVTDDLTGIHNRRGLYIAMKPLAYLARREREAAGVLIMEISNLKEINDAFGQKVGDRVLREAARAVSGRLRASDAVGRFGGDDFLALLTRFDSRNFQAVGEEIVRLVGEVAVGEARVKIAVGGACAVMSEDVEEMLEALIRGADGALDDAREQGKGCVVRELGAN